MDFFYTILHPIMLGEAWVMYAWHWLWDKLGMSTGWAWAMSIVGLTVVVRVMLIPLFVRQIHSSRRMQLIQPEMQKIQKKYKDRKDPESAKAMQAEMMDLYKRTGTNPFSSCLPILLQSPFFFGLFNLLNNLKGIAAGTKEPVGPFTRELSGVVEQSTIFGAQLSDYFVAATTTNTKILTAILIVLMSASTFITQHQLMRRNMPASALDNPFARQQKILLYVFPIIFAVSGINFPIGVLIYWLTTNVWTMGQQFYVIRRMPAPGSPADEARLARLKKHGKEDKLAAKTAIPNLTGTPDPTADSTGAAGTSANVEPVSRQRQQPKSAQRAKKAKGASAAKPVPGSSGSGGTGGKSGNSGKSGKSGGAGPRR